jgi:hypothetical protein
MGVRLGEHAECGAEDHCRSLTETIMYVVYHELVDHGKREIYKVEG